MKKPDKILIWFHDGYNKNDKKVYADVCFSDQRHRGAAYTVIEQNKGNDGKLRFIELWREE
jgi:hypothetical protein